MYCAIMSTETILKRVNEIDRNLQELRVDLLVGLSVKKEKYGFYDDKNLLKEIKKVRKNLWDEKYSKTL
jgi:uncharacterized protein (UPF0210 family)